jgi:hypothetical protein
VRDEAVVTDRDEFANEGVRLDPASLADNCPLLNLNERSDEGIVPNVAAIQIYRLYDGHIPAELYVNQSDTTAFNGAHVAEF